jgi:hypothetical protein
MGSPLLRTAIAALLASALLALTASSALAAPTSFERGTVDQSYTTTKPAKPTGVGFEGTFHAAGDPQGEPPAMTKLVYHPPAGFRYDTSVPDQCTATDAQLSMQGPDACPPGSVIGTGTAEGLLYDPTATFLIHEFKHEITIVNNANEQIVLMKNEGYTVIRGKFRADGALEFNPPTCFPWPQSVAACPAHNAILDYNATMVQPYVTDSGSYATTPGRCPRDRTWDTTIEMHWNDGAVDNIVTEQPCTRKKRRR